MGRYIIRRLVQMIPLLFAISVLSFLIMHLAPGDPTAMYIDPTKGAGSNPEALQRLRRQLGLDQPLYIQYWKWLTNTLRGNWGYSFINRQPVLDNIMARLPNTILLSGVAMTMALLAAIPIGILSAFKQYSVFDYTVTALAFFGISVPPFWLALVLMQVFANHLGWLPAVGMRSVREQFSGWPAVVDVIKHLILPATVLAMPSLASWMRYMRSSLLEVIGAEYIRTARAKGLRERTVILRHALRNALIPLITLLGLSLPVLVGGAFIIETVFGWPGMGRLGVNAILARDYPLIMGVTMMSSVLVILGNLLADIVYAWVDPRIRYQ
ncbi:MAG TPA: ABC transporter permease [Caldilineae bacterium]|nr:ABC transporter permease [Caldilineae bacterium]